MNPARGSVFIGPADRHALVVVSRTGRTGSALVVELRPKASLKGISGLPAVVETSPTDPVVDGYVLADYVYVVDTSELESMEELGALSDETLDALSRALAVALDLL